MAVTQYELQRERRIADNKRRMEEMGLLQLSADFNATLRRNNPKARAARASRPPPGPQRLIEQRRSSRLEGKPAPTYSDAVLASIDKAGSAGVLAHFAAAADECYTEAHVQALGDRKEEWTLFEDGYDAEGNRIYDKISGLTCHQCRQKTVCLHTSCSSCHSLRGVFCGDCLYMRYGENVKEARANPSWTCPVCRDLCNCSIHRVRRGWAPTGSLFRRAQSEGYKSVAHYLVLNNLQTATIKPAAEGLPAKLPTAALKTAEEEVAAAPRRRQPKRSQARIDNLLVNKKQATAVAAKKITPAARPPPPSQKSWATGR